MSTREKLSDNLWVKLVKKSVGLPTAGSSCCGAPKPDESVQLTATQEEPSGCGCGKAESTGSSDQKAQVESEST